MYPYSRTPMGNPYIGPIVRGYSWVIIPKGYTQLSLETSLQGSTLHIPRLEKEPEVFKSAGLGYVIAPRRERLLDLRLLGGGKRIEHIPQMVV